MIDLIIGGQFGSEGKGSLVSWLGRTQKYDLAIRTGSPNSGHTVITPTGTLLKLRQLPSIYPFQDCIDMYLPASTVVDKEVLKTEVKQAVDSGFKGTITVSSQAHTIEDEDRAVEKLIKTGTVGSGSGALRARKLLRRSRTLAQQGLELGYHNDIAGVREWLENDGSRILIETSQGFGLSLSSTNYPFVTSIDIDPYHLLGDAEVPYGVHQIDIWLVIRTFPIRIAGNSGPLENETTWEHLRSSYGSHIPDEHTTVTDALRRVGMFDAYQVRKACKCCHPTYVVLNFFDYVFPEFDGKYLSVPMREYLKKMRYAIDQRISHLGYGPGKIVAVSDL